MVGRMSTAFSPQTIPAPRLGDRSLPRPTEPPGLVVLDLDGTCLQRPARPITAADGVPRSVLPARTRDAVRRSVAANRTTVVVATGRTYRTALPWA